MGYDGLTLYARGTLGESNGMDDDPGDPSDPLPLTVLSDIVEAVEDAGFTPYAVYNIKEFVANGQHGWIEFYLNSPDEPHAEVAACLNSVNIKPDTKADAAIWELCDDLARGLAERLDLDLYDPDFSLPQVTVLERLASDDVAVRKEAVRQLGAAHINDDYLLPAPQAVAVLCNTARNDPSDQARHLALESLGILAEHGLLGDSKDDAVDHVAACLTNTNIVIQYWATYALGRLGPTAARALPALRQLTDSPEYGPRYGAQDAIDRIDIATGNSP